MNLQLDANLGISYNNNSQKIRVMTEGWFENNLFCPYCGNEHISKFENNRPVADFYCETCKNQFELKSKNGKISNKINDGAYSTMIERINSNVNPNLFCLSYSKETFMVKDLIFIPKYFFIPDIIEKRKPLSQTAHRAGWIGCNIIIGNIPVQGKVEVISGGVMVDKEVVIDRINRVNPLHTDNLNARGWLIDVLNCIDNIRKDVFSLDEIYKYEVLLSAKHPNNYHIRAKIRQQLQILRDKQIISFLGSGYYRKNI